MVPKITKKGASFKGAAAYYLHDKGADTTERVEWTETRNLATNDPELAWKIMAATADCRSILKEQAGIPPTGRKPPNVVMAYSISWHPDEKPTLTKEEMRQAALDSIEAIGAGDHQAILVCHNDEPQPHVHIVLNRVSPEDGRMLASSNEKLKLSRWAQAYEENRGKIWCEQRVKNNHARDMLKQFTRAAKDKPRHIFELEAQAKKQAWTHPKAAKALRIAERDKDAALGQRGRDMHTRHAVEFEALAQSHRERKRAIDKAAKQAVSKVEARIGKRAEPKREALRRRQQAERRLFERREKRLLGRVQNALEGAKHRPADAKGSSFGVAFNLISSRTKRQAKLAARHRTEMRAHEREVKRKIVRLRERVRSFGKSAKNRNLDRFYSERQTLKFTQAMDQAKLKAEWKQRNTERNRAWKDFRLGRFLSRHGVGKASVSSPPHKHGRGRSR